MIPDQIILFDNTGVALQDAVRLHRLGKKK
jgi:hypothetical protein